MPALSSTMTEGKIVSWLKTEGDKIAKGESVVVVESDKADMDVESCKLPVPTAVTVVVLDGIAFTAYCGSTVTEIVACNCSPGWYPWSYRDPRGWSGQRWRAYRLRCRERR